MAKPVLLSNVLIYEESTENFKEAEVLSLF